MNDRRFWSIVASLGPELSPRRFEMMLGSLTDRELRAFCLWLDEVEGDMDTPTHRGQAGAAFELARSSGPRRSWTAPTTERPAEFSELQATVVACGRDAWRAVVAGPALLTGGWPTGLGRAFRLAVADALKRSVPALRTV